MEASLNLEDLKASIEAEALRRRLARDGTLPPPPEPLTFAYFASLHGHDLVGACYRLLLGREPDGPGEGHHVRMLWRGDDKALVVGSIRYSPEGRAGAVPVLGLFPRFVAAAAQRMPFVGAPFAMVLALLTVNGRMRHARALEEHVRGRFHALGGDVARSHGRLLQRLDALGEALERRNIR